MTTKETANAQKGKDGYAIFVKDHKTKKSFGHAILAVTENEYVIIKDQIENTGSE